MKKKFTYLYVARNDFASAYLCLDCIINVYDDVDLFVKAQDKLCLLFEEEHKDVLNLTTALAIIDEGHNPRGAGRKPVLTAELRDEIRRLRDNGESVKNLASRFNISTRSVYLACRK